MSDTVEEWKVVPGYYNYYVSSFGRVFSLKTFDFMPGSHDANGYLNVGMSRKIRNKVQGIHVWVALTFLTNPEQRPQVDHINNIKSDNRLTNLRWATRTRQGGNRGLSKNSTTGVKGVNYNKKKKKYQAHICVDGIRVHIGYFKTIEEATQARKKRANEVYGLFTHASEQM